MSAQPEDIRIVWRDGIAWPANDGVAFEHIRMYLPVLKLAARQATQRRTAVQAGGNAGIYPMALAEMYDHVITFEPEGLNFECLKLNTERYENIDLHQAALGDSNQSVGMTETPGLRDGESCDNTGAWKAVEGAGSIPQMRIDDLGLDDLDFLQLDIEGYELKALHGALKTIERCSPVIMVEYMDHGDDPKPFLENLGYHRIIKGNSDHVYVREHEP